METAKLILNPARLRILQFIRLHGNACASDLIQNLSDIPRATIYHHLKILENNQIIQVVEETKVRGTIEKTYAMKAGFSYTQGDAPIALSTAFHLESMHELNTYFIEKQNDSKKDNVFFTSMILNVTNQEYAELVKKMEDVLKPYLNQEPELGRELRKLSIISAPPNKKK